MAKEIAIETMFVAFLAFDCVILCLSASCILEERQTQNSTKSAEFGWLLNHVSYPSWLSSLNQAFVIDNRLLPLQFPPKSKRSSCRSKN